MRRFRDVRLSVLSVLLAACAWTTSTTTCMAFQLYPLASTRKSAMDSTRPLFLAGPPVPSSSGADDNDFVSVGDEDVVGEQEVDDDDDDDSSSAWDVADDWEAAASWEDDNDETMLPYSNSSGEGPAEAAEPAATVVGGGGGDAVGSSGTQPDTSSSSGWDVADDWEAAASWEDENDETIPPYSSSGEGPAEAAEPSAAVVGGGEGDSGGSTGSGTQQDTSTSSAGWGVTDDWEANWKDEHRPTDSQAVFHQDPLTRMAYTMELASFEQHKDRTPEEEWIHDTVDKIMLQDDENAILTEIPQHQQDQDEDDDFYSSSSDGLRVEKFIDAMGTEIAMLVRCNQSPESMLIEEGRAVAELTDAERHDVSQLVTFDKKKGEWQPTKFFRDAIQQIFRQHARPIESDMKEEATTTSKEAETEKKTNKKREKKARKASSTSRHDVDDESLWIMDERGVSSWTEQSTEAPCTRFDPRVRRIVAQYGVYGKGYLLSDDLLCLYMETLVGKSNKPVTSRALAHRTEERTAVWRDLERHGFIPPVEQERTLQLEEIQKKHGFDASASNGNNAFMDECEIVDESLESWSEDAQGRWHREGKSSHEHVEVVKPLDKKEDSGKESPAVPLRMKDGEFVYIDEESCIGCTQCALAAPASFRMLENGRARTFKQRAAPDISMAVAACPVNCMHYVGYERLKELELARDSPEGDGRKDHRHFGRNQQSGGWHTHIPIHVARRESSENKKDSLYHFLRNKCYKSHACPQRGCYDCPLHASNPEGNPHLQKRRQEAAHVRVQHFIANGEAGPYRKEAEL